MNETFQLTSLGYLASGKELQLESQRIALSLFNRARSNGLLRRWWGSLTGRSTALRVLAHLPVERQAPHHNHVVFVSLSRIVGSESRSEDFDNRFNPLNPHNMERWLGIAAARRSGVALPPVELVRDGGEFYVRDGHHRISVAKALGQLDIEAVIMNG